MLPSPSLLRSTPPATTTVPSATRTRPLGKEAAVCLAPAWRILPASVQRPVAGSQISAVPMDCLDGSLFARARMIAPGDTPAQNRATLEELAAARSISPDRAAFSLVKAAVPCNNRRHEKDPLHTSRCDYVRARLLCAFAGGASHLRRRLPRHQQYQIG